MNMEPKEFLDLGLLKIRDFINPRIPDELMWVVDCIGEDLPLPDRERLYTEFTRYARDRFCFHGIYCQWLLWLCRNEFVDHAGVDEVGEEIKDALAYAGYRRKRRSGLKAIAFGAKDVLYGIKQAEVLYDDNRSCAALRLEDALYNPEWVIIYNLIGWLEYTQDYTTDYDAVKALNRAATALIELLKTSPDVYINGKRG